MTKSPAWAALGVATSLAVSLVLDRGGLGWLVVGLA
jgi:hypothetical protein